MKPTKKITNREVFGKNPTKLQVLPKKPCLREERALSGQSNSFSGRYSTGQNRFQKQSRQ